MVHMYQEWIPLPGEDHVEKLADGDHVGDDDSLHHYVCDGLG